VRVLKRIRAHLPCSRDQAHLAAELRAEGFGVYLDGYAMIVYDPNDPSDRTEISFEDNWWN